MTKIPQDNLKPEGEFEKKQLVKWYPGDRAERVIRKDNLRMEGNTAHSFDSTKILHNYVVCRSVL